MALRNQAEELRRRVSELEAALSEAHEQSRRTMAFLPIAVYTCDLEGRITYFNRAAARLWGQVPEQGDSLLKFGGAFRLFRADGSPLSVDETPMAEAVRTGKSARDQELIVERPDGSRVFISTNVDPLVDASGQRTGAVSALIDITDKKAIERRKDDFIAMLGHELRNPLAAIQSGLDLWASASPERTAWIRQVLTRQTEQLARIVDDLLDVSRIRRGKVTLRTQTVELSEVVAGALASVNDTIDERGHILEVSVPDGIRLKADPVRLEQILVNLLTNAARYTDEGGYICLSAEVLGDQVRIEVQDDGIGFSPSGLESIFDLLPQPGDLQTRGGLGIGLKLVRQLVEMHQGSISVASEGPGKGSSFTVMLPVGAIGDESSQAFDSPTLSRTSQPRRVLILDDNQDLAVSLSYLLTQSGHTVETAFDGASALRLAEAFRPDVTLLDVGLPDLDGMIVAERLRGFEAGSGRRMTIIGLSGFGTETRAQMKGRRLFDHYLVKPVSLQLLSSLIESSPRPDIPGSGRETPEDWRREARVSDLPDPTRASFRRVLVIEDSKAIADLTQQLLEAERYETAVAYDGQRGLDLVAEFKPDVILCDLNLAGSLSGWEVAAAVRKAEPDRTPVLVALTAWGSDEIRHALRKSAFDFHLSKPLNIRELERLISSTPTA